MFGFRLEQGGQQNFMKTEASSNFGVGVSLCHCRYWGKVTTLYSSQFNSGPATLYFLFF
jgi:hypothetical protein